MCLLGLRKRLLKVRLIRLYAEVSVEIVKVWEIISLMV